MFLQPDNGEIPQHLHDSSQAILNGSKKTITFPLTLTLSLLGGEGINR
jgi:hypothetical protein